MRVTLKQILLSEWLALLEKRHPRAIELGLDRVLQVAERLDLLRPATQIISVAGTNGKGSCVALLENMLLSTGVTVGCYTSPHLSHYNERICIAGQPLDDALICRAFTCIDQARGDISLTYFEFGTLAALWAFSQQELDVAILEVGLGGRLDAVNIVDANVAVITSIDLDHEQWLGEDRQTIGVEKAGIARAGKPLVCGDTNVPAAVLVNLADVGADVYLLGTDDFRCQYRDGEIDLICSDLTGKQVAYKALPLPLLPTESAVCAVQALVCAGRAPSREAVCRAFVETHLPGRFQHARFRDGDIILDVAHNPAAARLLADKLRLTPRKHLYALFGVLADKDIAQIIAPLLPVIDRWHVCELAGTPRAASAEHISALLDNNGVSAQCHSSVSDGLLSVIGQMGDNDLLVIFGSFYTVAGALQLLDEQRDGVE